MEIIKIKNLVKNYGDVKAVKSISLSIKEGEFVAFLGENGAGKSTTINIISTLLKKTSGKVIVNGNVLDKQDNKIRQDIGVVFQNKMLDDFLTVRENLMCRGKLYGISDKELSLCIESLGEKIGISHFIDRRYGKLSGGQKRRADIARALINEPKILILDEPTTGLDPYTRQSVWECVENLQKQNNLTVFLTTHYMEEAAKADRIIIIDKGEVIENDTPENLKIKYSQDVLKVYPKNQRILEELIKDMGVEYRSVKDYFEINLANTIQSIGLLGKIKEEIQSFEVISGNMDQVFMTLASEGEE